MSKQYVVIQLDEDNDVRTVWGPFSTDETAANWEGVPGRDPSTSYHVHPVYDPPYWGADDDE